MRIDYHPPLAWDAFSRFVAGRGAESVERMHDGIYWRTVRSGGRRGWLSVEHDPGASCLRLRSSAGLAPRLPRLADYVRKVFDLRAQPELIDAHLSADPVLRPLVRRTPGLRVPGALDGLELAVRAILGQRISVRVATILAGKVAATLGDPIRTPLPGLDRVFPTAARLAEVPVERLRAIGLGGPPVAAIRAIARAVAHGKLLLEPGPHSECAVEQLQEIPGIGPWTAQYIAMRALRLPDAFPHSDLGLCKALDATPAQVLRRAEAWRPWRAYAALHLWNSLSMKT